MGITRGAQQVLAIYLHYTWSVHTKSYSTLIYIYHRPTSKTSKVFIFHLWIKLTSPVFLSTAPTSSCTFFILSTNSVVFSTFSTSVYMYEWIKFLISLSSNSLPRLQIVILSGDYLYSIILAILFSTIILATTPTTELSISNQVDTLYFL